jgi:hypothetical protein
MTRLKAYRWMDIDDQSYRKPQEAQMMSTMVDYLQGIQTAKEASEECKNGSGNSVIVYGHFTRADNAYMKTRYMLKCPMEVLLLTMTHQQMTSSVMRHLRTAEKITRSHLIGLEGFRSDFGRVFRNVEFVCKKSHVCMLSTNVNQYLVFRPPQRTWWVYEWGAQVRKHEYGKSPHLKKPSSSTDHSNYPIKYNYLQERY